MATRTASEPVEQLLEFLNARPGISVTPRQIERWRQAGVLPPATWTGDNGDGSVATYRPPYAQGLAAVVAVRETRSLGQAALMLWADGWDVPPQKLRRAALAWLESHTTRYQRKFGGDPEKAASATAFTIARLPIGQLWMGRIGGDNPYRSLGDGLTQGFQLGFHDSSERPRTQEDFEQIGGVKPMASDAFEALGLQVPLDDIDARISSSSATGAGAAFREAS